MRDFKTIQEYWNYKDEFKKWNKKKKNYFKFISSCETDEKYVSEWTEKYMRNFSLDKETARNCILKYAEINKKYTEINQIIFDESMGKIEWEESKKKVEECEKEIKELAREHFKPLKNYFERSRTIETCKFVIGSGIDFQEIIS